MIKEEYKLPQLYQIFISRPRFIVISFILLVFFFSDGCKKQYIEKHYTGNFNFTVFRSEFHYNGTNYYSIYDTIAFQGTIVFNKKNEILTISYLPDKSFDSFITKDGILNCDVSTGAYAPAISGKFNNENEIEFRYVWGFDQYSGWQATDNVIGTRQ
jgi:hypothetical protein